MNSSGFTPTLRQLRAFHAVYQLGKLSAAAEQMAVTQSAVSVLIRQMEGGLGVRLFDRSTRSLQPTQAAREAVAVAARILRDVDSLGAGLRELKELRRGRVSLAVTPTLAEILLPPVLRRFATLHPQVRVVLDDCAPDQFVSRVVGEHVDFGVGTPERAAADVDSRTLLRDHLALVCPADHPLAKGRTVRWAQLAGQPVITVRPGYGIRPLIDGAAGAAGVALDVVNEVSFLSTALWMTACGLGVSIMPSAYARHAGDASLAVRPLAAPRVSRDIALVTKRGRSLSPAAQELVEVMRAALA
ncbi:LysR family transcriptional regulator [Ramlibacter sp. AN1015]|uniref:LysR family transcriptional regulator n=1 Tax=Ramlibacter sp. AN1015 TaxID=3133428 RepID=UPI0030BFBA08